MSKKTRTQTIDGAARVAMTQLGIPASEYKANWTTRAIDAQCLASRIRRLMKRALGRGLEAMAWMVNCPAGHEFDQLVFPDENGAAQQAEDFNDDCPEGQNPYFAIPLYTLEPK